MNVFDSLNDEAMADRLNKLADSPRFLSAAERSELLRAVASRLLSRSTSMSVDLGSGFTFVQGPPTGDLMHPDAKNGVFVAGVTEADARKTVEAMVAMELIPLASDDA